jgi:hypothetical protein
MRGMRVSASWAENTIIFEHTQENGRRQSIRVLSSLWVRLVVMPRGGGEAKGEVN